MNASLVIHNAMTDPVRLTLACHPQSLSRAAGGIDVTVAATASGSLTLAFALAGDLSALRIPEPRMPRRMDGLWRHSCFEVFLMAGEGPGYREFNFSPSGDWAAYTFHGYRDGGELQLELDPGVVVHRSADRLELDAEIAPDCLPPGRPLRLGLAAVVEAADGMLSYWALRHPPGKPDFHRTDAFVLQLPGPECVN